MLKEETPNSLIEFVDSPDFHKSDAYRRYGLLKPPVPINSNHTKDKSKITFNYFYCMNYAKMRYNSYIGKGRARRQRWYDRYRAFENYLVTNNLSLVGHFVKIYSKSYNAIETHEMESAGTAGLLRAVRKFDPSRGYQFSTLASLAVKREVAKAAETWHKKQAASLDEYEWDDRDPKSLKRTENCDDKEFIGHLLNSGILDKQELYIVRRRYALDGMPLATLRELGRELGVTGEWIRCIETAALDKMREASKELITI